jgi:hypothetical protein
MAKLFSLSAKDLLRWCRQQKTMLRMSNAKLAEASGTPKGTIDRLLAEDNDFVDYKYETIRPIVKTLFGSKWTEDLCSDPIDDVPMSEKVRQLEEDKLQLKQDLKELKDEFKEEKKDFKKQIKTRNAVILVFAGLLALAIVAIIALLLTNA